MTIVGSVVEGNISGSDGGGFGDSANTGNLTVVNSFFLGNRAAGNGGGIQEGGPSIVISNSTIQDNLAQSAGSGGFGGGLYLSGSGTVSVMNSRIATNTAQWGGGLDDAADALTVTGSTFQGNRQTLRKQLGKRWLRRRHLCLDRQYTDRRKQSIPEQYQSQQRRSLRRSDLPIRGDAERHGISVHWQRRQRRRGHYLQWHDADGQ